MNNLEDKIQELTEIAKTYIRVSLTAAFVFFSGWLIFRVWVQGASLSDVKREVITFLIVAVIITVLPKIAISLIEHLG